MTRIYQMAFFINCGSTESFAALDGREWIGDELKKFSSSVQIKGLSTSSNAAGGSVVSADQAQYKTARVSRSHFSYAFHLRPGPKFIRLHFNPAFYRGFKGFKDLFTVEAGPFTLLGNFSASLTADALGGNVRFFAKEFCINIEENQWLDIVFYPDQSTRPQDGTYAFINGIEIISIPTHLSYFHGEVQVVGLKSPAHIYNYNHTALEIIHQQIVKPSDELVNMFMVTKVVSKHQTLKLNNITWKAAVDVGFRYLIRIHFCEAVLKIAKKAGVIFEIMFNEIKVDYDLYLVGNMDENEFRQHGDYVTTIQGRKQDVKHNLLISIRSTDEIMDRNVPLKGFEILKLSNFDNSLASPNPYLPTRDSTFTMMQNLLRVCGNQHMIATAVVTAITLINIVVYKLRQIREDNVKEEGKNPSARASRLCRHFSLAEIKSATKNFDYALVIGNGGFGKVYKGIIDNGQETVAIKRLKHSSNQGAREFWTEIETLSELRHVNLISLIGYCDEQQEMILVYEYMIHGTLGDHLYKLARSNNPSSSLSWNQCLNICIGAGRGIDYLHTGHGIIHRDVKTSNILLDKKFAAKVSDFGLAKPENICESESHVSTNVKGTHGYFDPYYIRTRKLTRKSDIYAFGVVLFEVLCGRPALDPMLEEDERSLAIWARENISKEDIEKIISSNIKGEILPDSLRAFVRVAVSCLDDEPKKRPTMVQVVLQLQFALDLQEKPCSLFSTVTCIDSQSAWFELFKSAKPSNKNIWEDSSSGRCKLFDAMGDGRAGDYATDIKGSDFDWGTIQSATNGFSNSNIIGKGRGGTFYKGVLHARQVIAVKRTECSWSGRSMSELEIHLLSEYNHPNIMKLLGNFSHDKEKILVFEFLENKNLNALLCERRDQLPWTLYFKLVIGIARGLCFLHQSPDLRTIYSNIDPSNIFIDTDITPKIAFDYCKTETEGVICRSDYDAPEGNQPNQRYESDVYSFGVIVLEILSGMRHSRSEHHLNLIAFAWKLWSEGRALDLVGTLGIKFSSVEATRCIHSALLCTHFLPQHRPDMPSVLRALEGGSRVKEELRRGFEERFN